MWSFHHDLKSTWGLFWICPWFYFNTNVPLNFLTSFFDGIWYIAISFDRVVQKTCWLNAVGAILYAPSAHGKTVIIIDGTVDNHDDIGTNTGTPHDSHQSWAWVYKDSICSL